MRGRLGYLIGVAVFAVVFLVVCLVAFDYVFVLRRGVSESYFVFRADFLVGFVQAPGLLASAQAFGWRKPCPRPDRTPPESFRRAHRPACW